MKSIIVNGVRYRLTMERNVDGDTTYAWEDEFCNLLKCNHKTQWDRKQDAIDAAFQTHGYGEPEGTNS